MYQAAIERISEAASPATRRLRTQAELLSQTDVPVLITGEAGSGKTTTAQLIHSLSIRSSSPFMRVKCAVLTSDLLENELFGYEQTINGSEALKTKGLVSPRPIYETSSSSSTTCTLLHGDHKVDEICRAIQADPLRWDPEGEAMSSANQSYEVDGGQSPLDSQDALRWYALRTRARHEKAIEHRLRDHGMETFVPTTMQVHRWSDRKKKVEVPLFSCYVFIRSALSAEDRTRVYQVESVHGFVGACGSSLPIPDEQIESIQKVLTQTAPWRSYPFLKAGQRVRVRGGAMDGVEGVFLSENGDHSLIVSIDAIQRSMAVRIDGYDVEPV